MLYYNHAKRATPALFIIIAKLGALVIMTIMLTYLGLGCNDSKDDWLFIEGTVVDRETALPVDSAWVSFTAPNDTLPPSGNINRTDSLGNFYLLRLGSPRAVDVYAGKIGYETVHEVIHTGGQDAKGIVIDLKKSSE